MEMGERLWNLIKFISSNMHKFSPLTSRILFPGETHMTHMRVTDEGMEATEWFGIFDRVIFHRTSIVRSSLPSHLPSPG